ncbi:MAG TPA: response regulator [Candidatus Obscuribacterales bacterium]
MIPVRARLSPVEILLVEDSAADIKLTTMALKSMTVENKVGVVKDGDKALSYLRRQGEFANAGRPDLVLLDLNLPKKSGYEVLQEIKQDPDLKRIPVIILTTSEDEKDIIKTYNCHANSFITKPLDIKGFMEIVKSIEDFWFTIVRLPGE